MREIKDRFVRSNMWYFVLGYLNDTHYQPIVDRHLEQYDNESVGMYGFPNMKFKMEWMSFELFNELAQEAIAYYNSQAVEITEETNEKYAEK